MGFFFAVGSRATNGDGAQGDHASGTDGGDSSQSRAPPVIGTTGVAVSSRPRVSFSGASQHGTISMLVFDSIII